MTPTSALSAALCETFLRVRPRLLRRLARDFPGACASQVEDAVDQALVSQLEALKRPDAAVHVAWRTGGSQALEALLRKVAWRNLRGDHRRLYHRLERATPFLPDAPNAEDPLSLLIARRTASRIWRLVPASARRSARETGPALATALCDRLESGDTDVAVAARHGVERSLLCRAKTWIERECVL